MQTELTLISHRLCPYVQRAVIALTEKGIPFRRIDVDLANKPEWFRELSPLGKTPVLRVGEAAIFESAVILEYLEETQPSPLHPEDPLRRAEQRSWMEFGSAVLNDIAGFYSAPDETAFDAKSDALARKFAWLERRLGVGPYFDGDRFSLVDAAFGPVFRYFDVFGAIGDFGMLADKPKVASWRVNLAARPSVRAAVASDYADQLWDFLLARKSHLSRTMATELFRPARAVKRRLAHPRLCNHLPREFREHGHGQHDDVRTTESLGLGQAERRPVREHQPPHRRRHA